MKGQRSVGILNQRGWRGVAGTIDDCVVLSDLMCALYCAPWLPLIGAVKYRIAANAPAIGGMTIEQSVKAIHALWPNLVITPSDGTVQWAAFDALMNAGGPASVTVKSSLLPVTYGYPGAHRIAVVKEAGAYLIGNALDAAYDEWSPITAYALRKAMEGAVGGANGGLGLFYVAFPTVEQAFVTHPLYVAPPPPPVTTKLAPGLYEV